ncbi:MAG: AMP-binding protein, partial [Desulfosudaceae bacterium]
MSEEINALPMFTGIGLKVTDPAQTALVFVNEDGSDEPLTYADLFTRSNQMARALLQAGVGQGDTFILLMKNHPEFVYAMFAAVTQMSGTTEKAAT